ncbi:MAG TPA: FKBP-type peptidyl-prolyl cis-trans isomerase [Thermoplasmata archaeon]|nr:FKBP-type peptidyl-prolyl cis-trans isomerase [Thermoplasmata archaeon]
MARPLARDDSGLSDWIILLALVVAVAVVLGAYYVVFTPTPPSPPKLAGLGDTVYIDYIGTFQNDNLVFDTSIQSVAADNASYPKAFSFSWHASYTPLQFTIGDGSVVKGFDEGVRGLAQGQTATVVVPENMGYGPADASKIHTYPLVQTFPVRVTMNQSAFSSYYNQVAVSATNVSDPIYGWSVQVSILNGLVVVTNSPYPSEVLRPYGKWTAVVLSVDDAANNGTGLITMQNKVDPSLVDVIGGTSPLSGTFYLSAVDLSAGTYTLDFNKQVVGRTLVFQITLTRLSTVY